MDKSLTVKQEEILFLLCKGLHRTQVGDVLNMATTTVATHLARIRLRLGTKTTIQSCVQFHNDYIGGYTWAAFEQKHRTRLTNSQNGDNLDNPTGESDAKTVP